MAAYKVPTYGELIRMLEVAEMEAETSEISVAELFAFSILLRGLLPQQDHQPLGTES